MASDTFGLTAFILFKMTRGTRRQKHPEWVLSIRAVVLPMRLWILKIVAVDAALSLRDRRFKLDMILTNPKLWSDYYQGISWTRSRILLWTSEDGSCKSFFSLSGHFIAQESNSTGNAANALHQRTATTGVRILSVFGNRKAILREKLLEITGLEWCGGIVYLSSVFENYLSMKTELQQLPALLAGFKHDLSNACSWIVERGIGCRLVLACGGRGNIIPTIAWSRSANSFSDCKCAFLDMALTQSRYLQAIQRWQCNHGGHINRGARNGAENLWPQPP